MFFIPCDNWKTLFFNKVLSIPWCLFNRSLWKKWFKSSPYFILYLHNKITMLIPKWKIINCLYYFLFFMLYFFLWMKYFLKTQKLSGIMFFQRFFVLFLHKVYIKWEKNQSPLGYININWRFYKDNIEFKTEQTEIQITEKRKARFLKE